jgi:hypothetical protein
MTMNRDLGVWTYDAIYRNSSERTAALEGCGYGATTSSVDTAPSAEDRPQLGSPS